MIKKHSKPSVLSVKLHLWDRIVLFCIPCLFLIISTAMFILVWNFVHRQLNTITTDLKDSNYNISIQLTDYINSKADILDMISEFPEIYGMNRDNQKIFLQKHAEKLGFRSIFFADNEGQCYYPSENTVRDQRKEPFFKNISTTDFYITDPYYPKGDPFTTISRPIKNQAGQRTGTICGTIYLKTLQILMLKYEASSGGFCFIINPEGKYIAGTSREIINKKGSIFETPDSDFDVVSEVVENRKNNFGRTKYNGKSFYTYASYLKQFNWILVDSIPIHIYVESLIKTIVIFAVFFISFVLVFVSLVHVIFSWDKSNDKIYTDPLCGCGSRAACNAMLEELNRHYEKKISIIFSDLNCFKQINDNYGHEAGDEMLKVFSRHLNFVYGDYGFVGRNGGDEFIVFLYDMKDEDIRALWDELEKRLIQASTRLAYKYLITASYGLESRLPGDHENIIETLKRADASMYIDKAERKKRLGLSSSR